MLRGATLRLTQSYDRVSVLARSRSRIEQLAARGERGDGVIHPLVVDYTQESLLHDAIAEALNDHGPIELVVSWIHSSAPDAHKIIANQVGSKLKQTGERCRWFDVLGSAMADPSSEKKNRIEEFLYWEKIDYRAVILGFVVEANSSRWLSHSEISAGVIKAIREDLEMSIVGQVHP